MWWPFKRFVKAKTGQRKHVHVTVDQEIAPDGKTTGGTAYFFGDPRTSTKATLPIDALGKLALAHPKRFGLEYVELTSRDLPTARQAKRGKLYLAVKENPDVGWIALLGGLNISPPVCDCKQHSVDWHHSKPWPNRNRAVGMMVFEWSLLIKLFVHYDYNRPIRLRRPDDPDFGRGGHCCCSGV
jgi:hypothetical protein